MLNLICLIIYNISSSLKKKKKKSFVFFYCSQIRKEFGSIDDKKNIGVNGLLVTNLDEAHNNTKAQF